MVLKCKMCGGDILLKPGDSFGRCDSCDSVCTLPATGDETLLNRYNRANHLRRQGEFDKAITAYERMLEDSEGDAEAHWGLVLSKFGIEYVEDPATGRRVPTCHRVQIASILADEDYLAALDGAPDAKSRQLYEAQANEIAQIQKRILAISQNEKPYDVFICYKEADERGERTRDSAMAQEVYYALVNEGYKVFFSRITLEDKLGQEYEPYIFAALSSARVMLVIGTKPEYFNAVWVKNEWSRFLALIKADGTLKKRALIPCFKDMDPYDLPDELGNLQSQDMGRIGFMQDLIRGIRKILSADKRPEASQGVNAPSRINPLLRRATLFLEDGDWDSADAYAEKVLDEEPENSSAYLIKLMAELRVSKEEDLARATRPLDEYANYKRALRFADGSAKGRLNSYNLQINERLEEENRRKLEKERNTQKVLKRLGAYDLGNGDICVRFGRYKQTPGLLSGKSELEWMVLKVEDGKALLLSRFALEYMPFNNRYRDVPWADCSLRKWLNKDFLETAFSDNEIDTIIERPADEDDLAQGGIYGTDDLVFLLSEEEARHCFVSNSARTCEPTLYATRGANLEQGACWWWLRSPGVEACGAAGITPNGEVGAFYVNSDGICVRPAIWVKPRGSSN